MYIDYDGDHDILTVSIAPSPRRYAVSREVAPGVVVDFDGEQNPLTVEIFDASRRYARERLAEVRGDETWISLREAAEATGLSPNTLRGQVNKKRLRAERKGGVWLTTPRWLEEYLANREYNAKPVEVTRRWRGERGEAGSAEPEAGSRREVVERAGGRAVEGAVREGVPVPGELPVRGMADPWAEQHGRFGPGWAREPTADLAMAADVTETAGEWVISLDVPGVLADDIELTIEGGLLTVSAERKAPEEGDTSAGTLERRYGLITRTFVVPPGCDVEGVDARLDAGVLTIRIPRRGARAVVEAARREPVVGSAAGVMDRQIVRGGGAER